MNPKLSIIVCTYNPKQSIFEPCLKGIAQACKTMQPKEIVLVDNNSNNGFSSMDYVKSFVAETKAKLVVETKQGLTPARLKGIEETTGDILLYIDDDNYIPTNFFAEGIRIAIENPHIGAWSGQVKLQFEKKPEDWTHRYWGMLVYRTFDRDVWSNFPHMGETMPCGAGLFVRRHVADHYLGLHHQGKRSIQLDRSGASLFSGGDNDLAACACDLGMGVGLFKDLILDHFIPSNRITLGYLLKLAEGISASAIVFKSLRGEIPMKPAFKTHLANALRLVLKSNTDRAFYRAVLRGEALGRNMLSNIKS